MYQIDAPAAVKGARHLGGRRPLRSLVNRTVLMLGLTSLFTDISSEMVAAVLPLYLVHTVGFSPITYGLIDGIYQGATALVRLAGGWLGDRYRRHKHVAGFGYALSAFSKLAILAASSSWAAISAIIFLDRSGKGIRTAPRDALISLNSKPEALATAFGVHRALDTTGAMLGPLVAFGLLYFTSDHFGSIFVVSFCFAIIGLAILMLFVENDPPALNAYDQSVDASQGLRETLNNGATELPPEYIESLDPDSNSLRSAVQLLGKRRFRTLVFLATGLGVATMSDGFLYLGLQERLEFSPRFLPLLYVGTSLVYMFFAIPAGRLADRIGRGKIFTFGYLLLLMAYLLLVIPIPDNLTIPLYLALLGGFYAATDGVLSALVSSLVPDQLRGSGLAILSSATSVARLFGSVLFGAIWTYGGGLEVAVGCFIALLSLAALGSAVLLVRRNETIERA